MRFHVTAMFLTGVLASACVGEIDPVTGGGDDDTTMNPPTPVDPGATARQTFDQNVFPTVSAKCATASCHGNGSTRTIAFVAATAQATYDNITHEPRLAGAFDTGAPILSRIVNGHYATYEPTEKSNIQAWLAKELSERGTQHDLLREFSGCVKLTDFQATNMADATGNSQAEDGGGGQSACATCHETGGNKHVAGRIEGPFFTRLTTNRNFFSNYFTIDTTNNRVVVNEILFRQTGQGANSHLLFNSDDLPGMIALRQLYDLAATHLRNGECGSPTF